MLTAADIDRFTEQAGPGFTWEESRGGHRPTAKVREPLRQDIATRQGGICPVHGGEIVDGEFNHVVAQGGAINGKKVRRGYFPLNLFVGCATCNIHCERTYGRVIPLTAFQRPDVIPAEWTPFPVLKAASTCR